jgi:hypothetical protein
LEPVGQPFLDKASGGWKMIYSLRLAVCSFCLHNIGAQSRSRMYFQSWKSGSVVFAQGAAYRSNGFDQQGDESGIPQRGC